MARRTLDQMLLSHEEVTEREVREIVKIQREEGQTLYLALQTVYSSQGPDGERLVASIMCDITGCPFIDLEKYIVPEDLMLSIPAGIARTLQIIPISLVSGMITVAMADPLNVSVQDWVRETTRYDVSVMVTTPFDINHAIESIGSKVKEEVVHVKQTEEDTVRPMESVEDLLDRLSAMSGSGKAVTGATIAENEIISLVDTVLLTAIKQGSSDIHIEPYEGIFRLRYRQDGRLKVVSTPPIAMYSSICSRIKIMADLNIAEHRIPQDGRMKIKCEDREIDFRVSVLPTHHGEKIVLRILDREGLELNFEALGFASEQREDFEKAIKQPNGIVLVTGPTGSGKTTTLYSALSFLNKEDVNIVTLEDPVEYDLFAINQIQVNAKVGLTFASGLRSVLRQDPDVVMVGEIRDAETAEIAIKSALTGHLVLSTLHTNDAIGAVFRLLDMGAQPFMLAASLNLCQAQRLVRKLCPHCKEPGKLPHDLIEDMNRVSGKENPEIFKARGCPRCNGTGYRGRSSVIEMVPITAGLKDLIAANATISKMKEVARQKGMKTLYETGLQRVADGVTSLEEVVSVAVS